MSKNEKSKSVGVPQSFLRKIADTYSGDTIATDSKGKKSKLRRTFQYEEDDFVCVSLATKSGKILYATCYRVIAEQDYVGDAYNYYEKHKLGYEGMRAFLKGKCVVLTDKTEFTFQEGAKHPVGLSDLRGITF